MGLYEHILALGGLICLFTETYGDSHGEEIGHEMQMNLRGLCRRLLGVSAGTRKIWNVALLCTRHEYTFMKAIRGIISPILPACTLRGM